MRLNYDTFTGRRSAFVLVAASLCLLSYVVLSVCGPTLVTHLKHLSLSDDKITFVVMLYQDGMIVVSVLVAAMLAERDRSMKEKMGLSMDPGYSLQFLFPVFVISVLATFAAQIGLSYLLKAVGHEPKPQSLVDMFLQAGPLTFVAFTLITVIAAPVAEELVFRHIMYRFVRVVLYRKEAAVLVSLVFALFHVPSVIAYLCHPSGDWSAFFAGFPWEQLVVPVVPLFVLALFLQWQYERSKSVIPSTLIHAGFNLINVILLAFQVFCAPHPKTDADDAVPPAPPAVEAPSDAASDAAAPQSSDAAPPSSDAASDAPSAVPVETPAASGAPMAVPVEAAP